MTKRNMSFTDFRASRLSSAWVDEPRRLTVYVRRIPDALRVLRAGCDFDLANMSAAKPGNGALTAFLDKWEPTYRFYVENVMNARLFDYLKRRGYINANGAQEDRATDPDGFEIMSFFPCMAMRQ